MDMQPSENEIVGSMRCEAESREKKIDRIKQDINHREEINDILKDLKKKIEDVVFNNDYPYFFNLGHDNEMFLKRVYGNLSFELIGNSKRLELQKRKVEKLNIER